MVLASLTEPFDLLLPSPKQRDMLATRLPRAGTAQEMGSNALAHLQSRVRRAILPVSAPLSAYCSLDTTSTNQQARKRPRLDPPSTSLGPSSTPAHKADELVIVTQGQDDEALPVPTDLLPSPTQLPPPSTIDSDGNMIPATLSVPSTPTLNSEKRSCSPPAIDSAFKSDTSPHSPELISTGIRSLDARLVGGLRYGTITELVGPGSSGKTQVALSTVVRLLTAPGKEDAHIALVVSGGRAASARTVRRIHDMVRARLACQMHLTPGMTPKGQAPPAGPCASGLFRTRAPPSSSGIFRVRRPTAAPAPLSSSSDTEFDHDGGESELEDNSSTQAFSTSTSYQVKLQHLEAALADTLRRVHISTSPHWPAFQSMLEDGLPALARRIPGRLALIVLDSLPVLAEVDEGSREINSIQARMERSRRLASISSSLKALAAPGPPGSGELGLAVLVVNHVLDYSVHGAVSDVHPYQEQRSLWEAPKFDAQNAHSTGERAFPANTSDPVVAQLGPVWSSCIHARLVLRRKPQDSSLFPRYQQASDAEEYALSPHRQLAIAFCAWAPATAQGIDPIAFRITATGVHAAP